MVAFDTLHLTPGLRASVAHGTTCKCKSLTGGMKSISDDEQIWKWELLESGNGQNYAIDEILVNGCWLQWDRRRRLNTSNEIGKRKHSTSFRSLFSELSLHLLMLECLSLFPDHLGATAVGPAIYNWRLSFPASPMRTELNHSVDISTYDSVLLLRKITVISSQWHGSGKCSHLDLPDVLPLTQRTLSNDIS